jgi:hypothetical protein
MKDTLLHTGGVVGSIPTAPTIYPIEIIGLYKLYKLGTGCENCPKRTELDENTGGGMGEALVARSRFVLDV